MEEMVKSGNKPRVELYVRSLCPAGARQQQERVVDRLATLEEEGLISGFTVSIWGKRIDVDDSYTRTGRQIRRRLREFEQWARKEDVGLDSFYHTQTIKSATMDDTITTITLPVMGLAEYVDGEVTHVAPCTDGETVCHVEDRLEELASGEDPQHGETERTPTRSVETEL